MTVTRRFEIKGKFTLDPRRIAVWAAVILGVVALVIVLNVCAQWRPFTAAEGKFNVEFPGWPRRESVTVPTQAGTLTATQYSVIQLLHGCTYAVGYTRFPPGILDQMADGNLLQAQRDAAVNKTGGKVITERDLKTDAYEGKDLTIQAPGVGPMRLRILIVDDRVYLLTVSPVPRQDGAARVERFFGSFNLLP